MRSRLHRLPRPCGQVGGARPSLTRQALPAPVPQGSDFGAGRVSGCVSCMAAAPFQARVGPWAGGARGAPGPPQAPLPPVSWRQALPGPTAAKAQTQMPSALLALI